MRSLRSALVTFVIVGAACGDGSSTPATSPGTPGTPGTPGATCSSTANAVTVSDNQFNPSCTKVTPGTTVTWTWSAGNTHNVTFSNAALGASATQSSGTYQKAFPTAGTFGYACTLHAGMNGEIQVQ